MFTAIRTLGLLVSLLFLAAASVVVQAADDTDEFRICARCHGEDGNSTDPMSPSIAGFSADYIAASMKEYRDGDRECNTNPIKCKMAKKWTDEEISRSADHFSGFARVAPDQAFDEALAATGKGIHEEKCASCHSAGKATDGEPVGFLNGQWMDYLQYALEEYLNGARPQPDDMHAALGSLDDGQREALLHYYASGL